ncbi:MAG: hypothetical protein ACK4SX_10650 [Alcanivoracaceae bacterium]
MNDETSNFVSTSSAPTNSSPTKGAPTTGRVAHSLHDAVDAAAAKASGAEEHLREQAGKARTRAGEVAGTVASYARDNPLAAMGIAFAAGVVVASLARR